jgi:NTE family protein
MEHYSVETVEAVKDLRDARRQAQKNIAAYQKKLDQCPASPQLPKFPAEIDPYVIEVDFEAISDPDRRKYFLSLPTSFALEKDQNPGSHQHWPSTSE